MRILYGKKKAVPDFCPRCGSARFLELKGKPRKLPMGQSAAAFGDMLSMYLNMWRPVLGAYRGAPWAPAWWGECGSCTMDEAILGPSIFERMVHGEPVVKVPWQGGSFVVPFK